jgi:hypothetical protein
MKKLGYMLGILGLLALVALLLMFLYTVLSDPEPIQAYTSVHVAEVKKC